MTDHTRTKKIDGDSILFLVVLQVVAGNRYDSLKKRKKIAYKEVWNDIVLTRKDLYANLRPESRVRASDPRPDQRCWLMTPSFAVWSFDLIRSPSDLIILVFLVFFNTKKSQKNKGKIIVKRRSWKAGGFDTSWSWCLFDPVFIGFQSISIYSSRFLYYLLLFGFILHLHLWMTLILLIIKNT